MRRPLHFSNRQTERPLRSGARIEPCTVNTRGAPFLPTGSFVRISWVLAAEEVSSFRGQSQMNHRSDRRFQQWLWQSARDLHGFSNRGNLVETCGTASASAQPATNAANSEVRPQRPRAARFSKLGKTTPMTKPVSSSSVATWY